MRFTFLRRHGGGALLGGGGLLLSGVVGLFLLKGAIVAFLLGLVLWTMPKANDVPANQLTVVQGTVTDAYTGRPLPGVLLRITASVPHSLDYLATSDSVYTDAQGHYRLRFRNKEGLYYRVYFDCHRPDTSFDDDRYGFAEADYQSLNEPGSQDNLSATERNLTLGGLNVINFRPRERRTIALHTHGHRRTGYQFMQLPSGYRVPIDNRDTTIYLTIDTPLTQAIKIRYTDYHGQRVGMGDTAVALVLQNPTARFPDTVRATLTLVR
jgi:hypothetical protein